MTAGRASQDAVLETCLKHKRYEEDEGTGSLHQLSEGNSSQGLATELPFRALLFGENGGKGIARGNAPERKTERTRSPTFTAGLKGSPEAPWGRAGVPTAVHQAGTHRQNSDREAQRAG